jgi:hypothetical protein
MSPHKHSAHYKCRTTNGICNVPLYLYPTLHSLQALSLFFLTVYAFLVTAAHFHPALFTTQCYQPESSLPQHGPHNFPFIHSSVSPSLNFISRLFISNQSLVSLGLQSYYPNKHSTVTLSRHSRRTEFLLILLLLLAGDVSLNPGPSSSPSLNFSHLNVRSASSITHDLNKPAALQDFIINRNINVLALSETWLSTDTCSSTLNSLTPVNFTLTHLPRPVKTGGGLAFIYHSSLKVSNLPCPTFTSFECQSICITLPSTSLTILNIYRPPSSSKTAFLSEFSTLLENVISLPSELLITGDFNFHLDTPVPPCDTPFLTLLDCFSLTQHVSFPTHSSGHTLDLLITRSSSNLISTVTFTDPGLSDHLAILTSLSVPSNTRPPRITKTARPFHKIDTALFSSDITSSSLYTSPATTLENYVSQFNSTLSALLDKHAPEKTISCSSRAPKPFINKEILQEKAKRSKLETIFRRTRSPHDQNIFKIQSRLVAKLITSARRTYFKSVIANIAHKPHKLWSTMNSLLSRTAPPTLPSSHNTSPSKLASSFLSYFSEKITKLSSSFPTSPPTYTEPTPPTAPPCLSDFLPASNEEVRNAILSSSNATCQLDIIPTTLLKSCLDSLLYPITTLINLAISEGTFPTQFKHAVIYPKLKKHSLPSEDLSSYRPISNLNFISKILERIIHNRINNHLQSFPSISPFQSAYRKFHSTETALLRISNDLLTACNEQKVTALILLDLSAAFDTIDHKILLSRLRTTFGICGTALSLLSSYLIDRTQSVSIGNHFSESSTSPTGVPQGSVLGPLLFCLYTTPLSTVFDNSPVLPHFYADDSQLYISFSSTDSASALSKLSSALDSTYEWLTSNRLSVNPSKTEYLLIGTPQQRVKVISSSVAFHNNILSPSPQVRNLGVIFDSDLSFSSHISNICRTSFHQIRQLRQVRSSLDTNSAIILANALVSSKLDYCNSLLYSLPESSLDRLQRVQNSLARVVMPAVKRCDHIKPTLRKLHWLPISQRITFKIASLTYKTLQHKQPAYLYDLLRPYVPTRNLRSTNQNLLSIPNVKSAIGRRSFSYAAPKIWNSLPPALRASSSLTLFLSGLKTHLFPP